MNKTKIEWCDSTWNPVTGCYHNCEYCYARGIANRFAGFDPDENPNDFRYRRHGTLLELEGMQARRQKNGKVVPAIYPLGFTPTLHRYRLDELQRWTKPRTIFVCSMADLFGDWVPDDWIYEVFAACKKAPQHRYLFLTKNPKRYEELDYSEMLPEKDNMWYGITVTNNNMPYIASYNYNTFLSVEPLLEAVDLNLEATKWIIIGAETGSRKDKVIPKKEWVDNICKTADLTHTPVFMKDSLIPIVGEQNMRHEFPW